MSSQAEDKINTQQPFTGPSNVAISFYTAPPVAKPFMRYDQFWSVMGYWLALCWWGKKKSVHPKMLLNKNQVSKDNPISDTVGRDSRKY